jgi:predicted MFS family arabinose efflux permease
MLTAPGLIAAASAPAALLFAGAVDRRRLLLALTGLLCVADLICGFAPTFAILIIGRALFGAGLGGFWSVALAAGGRLVPARHLPRAISLILAGITIATIIGLPVGSLIGSYWSWRASFVTAAVLAALAGLGQSVVLPSLPAIQRVTPTDFKLLLVQRKFRSALLLVICLFGGNLAAYTYLAPYLQAKIGPAPATLPIVLLVFGITSFLANVFMPGPLARYPRTVVWGQVFAMALALLGLALPIGSQTLTLVLLLVWAVPFGAVPLCLNHWVQQTSTQAPEAGSALYVSTVQCAIAAGSASGALAVAGAGLSTSFLLGAGLAIAGGAPLIVSGRN